MKTLQILDDKVYYSSEPEPCESEFYYMDDWYGKQTEMFDSCHYTEALKQWRDNLIPVANAELMDDEDPNPIIVIDIPSDPDNMWLCYSGQTCEVDDNDNVTKII